MKINYLICLNINGILNKGKPINVYDNLYKSIIWKNGLKKVKDENVLENYTAKIHY